MGRRKKRDSEEVKHELFASIYKIVVDNDMSFMLQYVYRDRQGLITHVEQWSSYSTFSNLL